MWFILPLILIHSLLWLTNAAQPPLDCNYVSFPMLCVDSSIDNCTTLSYSASPIDVCWVEYDSDTDTTSASKYECNNSKVFLSVWEDADECSSTVTPIFTLEVTSPEYKCNSQNECPYTVTETYLLPSGAECEVPSSPPRHELLIIMGHCFNTTQYGFDLSMLQSWCDVDTFTTWGAYNNLDCNPVDELTMASTVSSGDGACFPDGGDTVFQRESACATPAPTRAPIETVELGCNYVAFPKYTVDTTTTTKNYASPIDVCWVEMDAGTPSAHKYTCNIDNNAVLVSIWSNTRECIGTPDIVTNVTALGRGTGFECGSAVPCPYSFIEDYHIPSQATCNKGVLSSSVIPEEWITVTDHCFATTAKDEDVSTIHSSCDSTGTSTYYQYANLDCNDQAMTAEYDFSGDGSCYNNGADFYRDVTCLTTIPPTRASATPTSAPTSASASPTRASATPTSAPTSASASPTRASGTGTPTRASGAPTSASASPTDKPNNQPTAKPNNQPTVKPSDRYMTFTIQYDGTQAVISQVTLSIDRYLATIPIDIDYSFHTTPQNHVVVYLYGSDSELAYVDKDALVALVLSDLVSAFAAETTSSDNQNNDGKEETKEEDPEAQENSFETITLVIMILLALIIFIAVLDGKKLRKNDYFQFGALISASLQILDCISDILFAIRITSHPEFVMVLSFSSPLLILFLFSIFFILLPVGASVFQLHAIIHQYWKKNDQLRGWLRDYMYLLFMVSFVCGSSFSAIQLCSSNAFDLRFFSIPLSRMDRSHFQYKRVYSVVLLENLPQLVIAICFAIIAAGEDSGNNDIVYISMTFSAMSIIMMAISAKATKLLLDTQDHGVITMHATGKFGHNIAFCRKRTNPLRDRMSVLLGVDQALLEIPKPQQIHQGLRIEIILLMNQTTMEEEEVGTKIMDICTHKEIAEFMAKCWKLEDEPSVDIIKFEQNQAKRRTMDMGGKTNMQTELQRVTKTKDIETDKGQHTTAGGE